MSEAEHVPDTRKGLLAAAVGAFLGGVGTYVLVALMDPVADVSTAQFLSFDEKGELELEGVTIIALLVFATLAAGVGCWAALRWTSQVRPLVTGLLMVPLLGLAVVAATGVEDWGPELAALSTVVCALTARATVMVVGPGQKRTTLAAESPRDGSVREPPPVTARDAR